MGLGAEAMSPNSPFHQALDTARLIITCGSGGVGKTTTAAALGLAIARNSDRNVLVVTIDPARRLADALGLNEIGNHATPVSLKGLRGALCVAMLDTSASWDDLVRRHAPDATTATKILANPLYRNITQRFVQSHDYIAMERLYDLNAQGSFDVIVIDTPPSRHALDFLDAPQRMSEFFSSPLLKWITLPYRTLGARAGHLGYLAAKPFYQIADRILGSQFLEEIAEFFLLFQGMYSGFVRRADAVTSLLHQPTTGFVVVSTPEPTPLQEAEFFIRELTKRRLHLSGVVFNRVLPELFRSEQTRENAEHIARRKPVKGSSQTETDILASELARNYLEYAALAMMQEQPIRELESLVTPTVRVPLVAIGDSPIDAIDTIAETLWESQQTASQTAPRRPAPRPQRTPR